MAIATAIQLHINALSCASAIATGLAETCMHAPMLSVASLAPLYTCMTSQGVSMSVSTRAVMRRSERRPDKPPTD